MVDIVWGVSAFNSSFLDFWFGFTIFFHVGYHCSHRKRCVVWLFMQSRQLILIALYAPHSTCQLFQMAKAFREVKTVCMHLLSSKETATPIWHRQGLKNLLRADTRTHTFSQSPYLANRIWQIGKQTVLGTDWRTDRQTHAAQTDRANIQTAICTHSKTEGGLPLVPTCARALCAKLKMWLCVCFFLFPQSQSPSTAV